MKNFYEFYYALLAYREEHGNLKVPQKYRVCDYQLGKRVSCVRQGIYRLEEWEKDKLNEIGFIWEKQQKKTRKGTPNYSFERIYKMLLDYKREYGDCNVKQNYVTPDGDKLGIIVSGIRSGNRKISDKEREQLDFIGFVWKARNKSFSFEEVYHLLVRYIEEHGDCKVPTDYVTQEGVRLGPIVASIRSGNRKVSDKERERLDSIGFVWITRNKNLSFEEVYRLLVRYKEAYGNCNVPERYVTKEGIRLGRIVDGIRSGNRKVSDQERKQLDSIGFVWEIGNKSLSFEEVYKLLIGYADKHGNCNVPHKYITQEGIHLGQIVGNIRSGNRKISDSERKQLDSIGFVWKTRCKNLSFEEVYQLLVEYVVKHGNCNVPNRYVTQEGVHLGRIVSIIRSGARKVSDSEKEQLDSIGFLWYVREK